MKIKDDDGIILFNTRWSQEGPYCFKDLSNGELGVLLKMIVLYQTEGYKGNLEFVEAFKLNHPKEDQYITSRVVEVFEFIEKDMDSAEFKKEKIRQSKLPKEPWEKI